MPKISSKHQATLPVEALERAGMHVGDEVDAIASFDRRVRRAARGLGVGLAV